MVQENKALRLIARLIDLWDSEHVSEEDYNEEMFKIEAEARDLRANAVYKGFWDVYEPGRAEVYATVFNSAEAQSYRENGFTVKEQAQ